MVIIVTLYFIRHGETEWNANGDMYCGRTDINLSKKGEYQVVKNKFLLKNIEISKIISSPLIRAKETAKLMTNSDEIEIDNRVIEVDFGKWEGLTKQEIWERYPKEWNEWVTSKDDDNVRIGEIGESYLEVKRRALTFIEDFKHIDKNQNVLIFSHNTFIRLLIVAILEMPNYSYRKLKVDNASLTKVTVNKEEIKVDYINKF
ncbi:histidine phosphatase family protein [Mammaliicoccus sp. P-M59]|uniref:histidine phosphatase family protein n=1 Tax=Mammaliicoccus sp. P-M59 TaxID=2898718 RepID=UPI001EFA8A65